MKSEAIGVTIGGSRHKSYATLPVISQASVPWWDRPQTLHSGSRSSRWCPQHEYSSPREDESQAANPVRQWAVWAGPSRKQVLQCPEEGGAGLSGLGAPGRAVLSVAHLQCLAVPASSATAGSSRGFCPHGQPGPLGWDLQK